jgi:hypothetical protein
LHYLQRIWTKKRFRDGEDLRDVREGETGRLHCETEKGKEPKTEMCYERLMKYI